MPLTSPLLPNKQMPAPADGGPLIAHGEVNEIGDAAAGGSTTAVMSVGDIFNGEISSGGDSDWVRVDLVAGESYVFSVWGTGGSTAGLSDPTLSLRSTTGSVISTNDDVTPGENAFSQIEFTATSTGTYYLDVGGYSTSTGDYRLQAATNVFTVEEVATQLTEFGWGIPTPLRHDERAGDTMTVNLTALTAEGQQLARWALESWSNVTGITFLEVGTGGDLRFDDNQSGAFAGPGSFNPATGTISFSTVNISTGWLSSYGTTIDSYSFQTYVHEIGHALGLYHSGQYDGAATYGVDNHYLNDSYQMTVMSYFDMSDNTSINASDYLLLGPMVADIYAIQSLYGTNVSTYSGNTTWGANSNVGGYMGTIFGYIFDGVTPDPSVYDGGESLAFTLFDSGGTDTVDLSPVNANQRIDLREGAVSDIGGATGNMVIALGTVVENAIGGSGNDRITGNSVANQLEGRNGNDTLEGLGGADTLTGGFGNDEINGGGGVDTAMINATRASVTVTDLGGGSVRISSSDGTDTYQNVENFTFSDGTVDLATLLGGGSSNTPTPDADSLFGTSVNDVIDGLGGDDTISGLGGNDSLMGGHDNDSLLGGSGADTLNGGLHNDTLEGGGGWDRLFGGYGNDSLTGDAGNDLLRGGGDNDWLSGGDDDDVLFGDRGVDTLFGGDGADDLYGGYQGDEMHGGASGDLLKGELGADTMYGDGGNDSLFGGFQDDVMYGGDGNDLVRGGGDDDILNGNLGRDTLFGDRGNDTLYGNEEGDFLYGGFDNDLMFGGDGGDLLNGELGADTLNGDGGDDELYSGFQNDLLNGGAGDDTLRGGGDNDVLNGGADNDEVHGDLGNDQVNGDAGNDLMTGGGGNDTLNGGTGNDTMAGGSGSDTFIFVDGHGDDTVLSFETNDANERLDLSGVTAISDLDDLLDNHATQNGGSVVIDTGGGDSITLVSIQLSTLGADDFIF